MVEEGVTPIMELDDTDLRLGAQEVTIISDNGSGKMENTNVTSECDSSAVGKLVDDILTTVMSNSEDSATPKKKIKECSEHGVGMDLDPSDILGSENKENILRSMKEMNRKDLEDLLLTVVVECLTKTAEVGKFRAKTMEMQLQKEKMQQRVTHLQKQVVEMGKAIKLLIDNQTRDPNNLNANKKRPPPIRFYRSVGLQVAIEPPVKSGPTKVLHVNNVNGISLNGTVKPLSTQNISPNAPIKRPGPKSLTDPNAMRHNNGPTPAVNKGVTKMNGQRSPTKVTTTNAPTAKQIATPTVVDLTDDNGTTESSGNVIRLMNTSTGGYQIVSANGSYLGTTAGTNTRGVHAVVVRNIAPKTVTSTGTGPQPRPVGVGHTVVTIPNRAPVTNTATVGRPPTPQQRRMQLPPFPPAVATMLGVPRGRVLRDPPPKPSLTLNEQPDGIVLSWTMNETAPHADVASYQIFACQEALSASPGKTSNWKKVGDVKALPLPMACTLSQFTPGNRYFFIVRAVDVNGRSGTFCDPTPITLQRK